MLKIEKTKQERKNEKQKAFDYCVYMMLSSYYKKARCLSDVLETNLYLHYKELNDNQAVELEKEAINLIEKLILPNIPENIEGKYATVTILPWSDIHECHGIKAVTDQTVVTVYIKNEGKKKTTVFRVK